MSGFTGFFMFFLSFLPLWVSVLFLDFKSILEKNPYTYTEKVSIVLIMLTFLVSFLVLKRILNPYDSGGSSVYTIHSASEEKTLTSEFFLSYMLPLFAFDFTLWDQVILFLIFFSVLAHLSIYHNHFSLNILLEHMKYRFYHCELVNDDGIIIQKIIISKKLLSSQIGDEIRMRSINNDYSVEVFDLSSDKLP